MTDRSKPRSPLFPAEAAPARSSAPRQALRRSGRALREETQEVSLCDTLPASESIVAALANVTDQTVDISPQELSLAAPRVANDVHVQAARSAGSGVPSRSLRAPAWNRSGKGWLWATGALLLLLAGAFFQLESSLLARPATLNLPLSRAEPAAEVHTKAGLPAATGAEVVAPSAPEADTRAALATTPPSADAPSDTPSDAPASAIEAGDSAALDATLRAALARAEALAAQGDALRKRRKLGPARSKYRAALQAVAAHPAALYGLSQLAIQLRDGEQAVELALALVKTEPDRASYLLLLGDAYRAAGRRSEAREAWTDAARQGSALARKRLR